VSAISPDGYATSGKSTVGAVKLSSVHGLLAGFASNPVSIYARSDRAGPVPRRSRADLEEFSRTILRMELKTDR
jgi:hypothetical protein